MVAAAGLYLDDSRPHLRVRRSLHQDGTSDEPKTNAATRRVALPEPMVRAALRSALARRADPDHAVMAPQLWLDYRGRPLSPSAVGKAFTVLVRSAGGVELNVR